MANCHAPASTGVGMFCWRVSRFRILALLVGGFVSMSAAGVARQSNTQDTPSFRISVEQIEVTASVFDRAGNFVHGLTREDFEIYEDGRRQDVNAVALVDIPHKWTRGQDSSFLNWRSDASSNDWLSRGRAYLIVLDAALIQTQNTLASRRAARQFVEQYLSADDMVALISTGGALESVPLFTQDRDRILRAIDAFQGRRIRENGMANEVAMTQILEQMERQKNGGKPPEPAPGAIKSTRPQSSGDPNEESERRPNPWLDPSALSRDAEDAYLSRVAAETLRQASRLMSLVPMRRRAIVYFSEGTTYNIDDSFGQEVKYAAVVRDAMDEAIGMATRSNVTIYAVDPRGVAVPPRTRVEMDASQRRMGDPLKRGLDSLRRLGDETGGFAAMSNDFGDTFSRMVRAQSQYYVIGYGGSPQREDGRFHRVDVRVRRPDVRVAARPGYTALTQREAHAQAEWVRVGRKRFSGESPTGRPDIAAALAVLLARPVPTPGLGLRVQAVPLKKWRSEDGGAVLVIEIDGRNLAARLVGAKLTNTIEVGVAAVDDGGNVRYRQAAAIDLSIARERAGVVGATGVRWVSRVALPPGRYQLRVAAVEQVGGKEGSTFADVDLPDYSRASTGLSGVVVTSKAAALQPTRGWAEVNRWQLPHPMTASRTFTDADVLTASTELYGRADAMREPQVVVRVLAADGEELTRTAHTFSPRELKDDRYVSRVTLPLAGMTPGTYVLQIEGRSGTDKSPETRVVPFNIVSNGISP